MRQVYLAIIPAMFALTACGGGADEPATPKTPEEVAEAAGNLVKQRPGQYTSQAKLIDFQIPGLPKDQADRIRAMSGEMMAKSTSFCLTQEQVDKGMEDAVRQLGEGTGEMACEFTKFDADGNDLDAKLTCSGPNGSTADMAMTGTVQEESSRMIMDMSTAIPQMPGGEMKMKMEVNAQRTGDCT